MVGVVQGFRWALFGGAAPDTVSYTHLRAHETVLDLVCRLLLEKKKQSAYNYVTCIHEHTHEVTLEQHDSTHHVCARVIY